MRPTNERVDPDGTRDSLATSRIERPDCRVLLIRDGTPADLDELREVFLRSSLSNQGDRADLLARPEVLDRSEVSMDNGPTRVCVSPGDRIVGFLTSLDDVNQVLEIVDLFVDPDWTRRGIGRALVSDVMATARSHRSRCIEVTANLQALGFYEKMGFVFDRNVDTTFGPAPRLHIDLEPELEQPNL